MAKKTDIYNRFKKDRIIFNTFLISYAAILLVSGIIMSIILGRLNRIVKEDTIRDFELMLQQSINSIQEDVNNTYSQFTTLTSNMQIEKVINSPVLCDREEYRKIKAIFDFMPSLESRNPIYLVIPQQQVVISAPTTYRYSVFYDFCIDHKDISSETWAKLMTQRFYDYILTGDANEESTESAPCFYLLRSLPLNAISPSAQIIALFSRQRMNQIFQWASEQNCRIYLLDETGKILYRNTQDSDDLIQSIDLLQAGVSESLQFKYQGKTYLGTHAYIDNIQLQAIAISSADLVLMPLHRIQQYCIRLFLLFLLMGISLAIVFSKYNSQSLNEIVALIERNFTQYKPKGIKGLRTAISAIINDDAQIKKSVSRAIPYIQSEQRKQLLMGKWILDKNQPYTLLETIQGKAFSVLVIELSDPSETDSLHSLLTFSLVKEDVRECESIPGPLRGYYVDISINTCAMILASDETDVQINSQNLKDYAGLVYKKCAAENDIILKIAVGEFQKDLQDVFYSYIAAQNLLETGIPESDGLVTSELYSQTGGGFYSFSVQTEQHLISAISTGNQEETEKLLDLIYNQNFVDRILSSRVTTWLYYEFDGLTHKLIGHMRETLSPENIRTIEQFMEEIRKYRKILSPAQAFHKYRDTFLYICSCAERTSNSKKLIYANQFRLYIESHYTDPSLSLTDFANSYGFSTNYISRLFKEITGSTFSDYLENKRLEVACTLLRSTDLTISEISEKTGYYSPYVFRRAFKRVFGLLPTDYRHHNN